MKKTGPELTCDYAHRLGIKSKLDCVPSLALGTTDLSVHEMVSAYAPFVNGGYHYTPKFITRVEDKFGNILQEFYPEAEPAISEETAYTMSMMLMRVVDQLDGTAHSLRTKYGFENNIGGKTGTTQKHSDGWFMGVTPELVAGTWVGCAEREVRFKTIRNGQGARMALPIWAKFMQKAYADKQVGLTQQPFLAPEGYNVKLDCEPVIQEINTEWEDDIW